MFIPITLDGIEIPLVGSFTFKAAMKQIKLLLEIILISGMVFLPMHKELSHKVWYDVDQCILGPKKHFVGADMQDICVCRK